MMRNVQNEKNYKKKNLITNNYYLIQLPFPVNGGKGERKQRKKKKRNKNSNNHDRE